MTKRVLRASFCICLLGSGTLAQAQSLTIGYTNCLAVANYSQALMNEIGQAKWYFAHASVGECISEGVTNLNVSNPGFYQLRCVSTGNVPPGSTTPGVIYQDDRGNLVGNGDYSGDWQWKVAYYQTAVSNGWHYPTVNLALSKFCFLDIWYATSSSAVSALLNGYLNSMLSLEAAYPQTVFVYATMPVTTLNYYYENIDTEPTCDYWRNVYNNNLRAWCAANNRVLFDIADIEAHDNNGNLVTFMDNGMTCEELWSGDNQGGDQCCGEVGDGAHPTNFGAEELLAQGLYAVTAATLSRWTNGATNPPAGPAPVANNDSYTFTENSTLTVGAPGVLANDTDTIGYTLTAKLASNPAHGTLTLNANGSFTYTPVTNFSGSDSFTYYATDGTSNSSVATVTLTGLAAGVLFSDNFARATDPGPLTPWVAEAGAWTVTGGTLEGNDPAQGYGAVYVTNSWSNYTVQASVRFSTASAYGAGICGRLNPATGARYAAWVYPEGSSSGGPTLKLIKFQSWTAWSYQGAAYTPMQQATLAGVGTNWHTLQLSFQGNQIAVTYDGNQVVSVADSETSPYPSGSIGFDMYTGSTPYAFSIANALVTGSGAAPPKADPVARNDSYSFTENTTLTVAAPGVLANDTDTAGFTLTAVPASNPAHGTLTLNPNGAFEYTPAANFSGSDSFTYYASDGTSNSTVATVTLAGLGTGVLFSDNFARATDPGPLTPWVAESGAWTVTGGMMQGNGATQGYGAVYVTNSWNDYTVQGSIRFSSSSAYGGGISGRLNPATGARYAAWVYPEGSPAYGPILKLIKFQSWTGWSYQGSSYMPIQQANLSAVGTNWHTLQLSFQSNQIAVSYDGNQVLNVADAEASPYSNGAIGMDMYAGSPPFTFEVENMTVTGSTVTPPKPAPVANNDSYSFTENTALTVGAPGVLANDTDTPGYTLTAVLASGPAHGTLTLNANGSFTYTPVANFSGADSFVYYASDGTSNSSVATVTLNGIVFSDNFARATDPGPLAPWAAKTGAWTVTGGMLQGIGGAQSYGAVYVTNSWSNYTAQASVRFSTASAYGGGLTGRVNPSTGARYAAWIYPEGSPSGGPTLKLIKFQSWTAWSYQGAAYTPIQQVALSGVSTNWHTLQLSFQGNQIAVSYDGSQVLSAADAETSPYANGAIGFDMYTGSTPDTFEVENVTVSQ